MEQDPIKSTAIESHDLSWMQGAGPAKPTTVEDNLQKSQQQQQPSQQSQQQQQPPAAQPAPAEQQTPAGPGIDPETGKPAEQQEPAPKVVAKIEGNPLAVFAKHWNDSGFIQLPEDVDPETLDEDSFDKLFFAHKEQDARNTVRQEIMDEYGLDADALEARRLQRLGLEEDLLQKRNTFDQLRQYSFEDPHAEEVAPHVRQYIELYYQDINMNPTLAERNAARDMEDKETLPALLESIQAHWDTRFTGVEETRKKRMQDALDAKAASAREKATKLKTYLDAGEFGGAKFTPQQVELIRRGLQDKTETVIGQDGKPYKVTLVQKKRMERAQTLEMDLLDAAHLVLGTSFAEIRQQTQRAAGAGLTAQLNKLIRTETVTPQGDPAARGIVSNEL